MLQEPSWLGAAGHFWQVCGRVVSPPLPIEPSPFPRFDPGAGAGWLPCRACGGFPRSIPPHCTSPRPVAPASPHCTPIAPHCIPIAPIAPHPEHAQPSAWSLPGAACHHTHTHTHTHTHPPYLSGAWPGLEPGKGRWCPVRSRAASGTERGQRLPCPPLSLLAGEEPGYSQPLVCGWGCGCVQACVCVCVCVCVIPPARGHREHRTPQASPHPKDASSCIPEVCPRPWYPRRALLQVKLHFQVLVEQSRALMASWAKGWLGGSLCPMQRGLRAVQGTILRSCGMGPGADRHSGLNAPTCACKCENWERKTLEDQETQS